MASKTPPTPEVGGKYMNPYLAGFLLGIVLFLAFLLTGHGLGASGGIGRVTATINNAAAPGMVDHSGYIAKLTRTAGALSGSWVVWMVVGLVVGAFTSGLIARRTRPQIYKGPHVSVWFRLVCALIGGAFMGYGSQWGRGCTSGQGLSGGATLAAGSWAFMFAIFAGAYILAYPFRKLWR